MTVKEAAFYLGVSEQRVRYLAQRGRLKVSARDRYRLVLDTASVEGYSAGRPGRRAGGQHDPADKSPDPYLAGVLNRMLRTGGTRA